MGDFTSPPIKREPNLPFTFQPQPYQSTPPSMSNGISAPPARLKQRSPSRSPPDNDNTQAQAPPERAKRQRTSASRTALGRAAVPTMPPHLVGEEITYTPTTHRISKAKKGKKVHNCQFPGCPKVFTRAEHRRRHEANHNAHPAFACQIEGCKKPFQRADLLARHMERQHNMPIDTASTRSGRSRGSMSEISASPAMSSAGVPRIPPQYPPSALAQTQMSSSMGPGGEKSFRSIDYRTHSVPPSLHDRLASQPIGTAPRGLAPEILYGFSPSGDSLYSSSDSCYSPLSEYVQAPQALTQHYQFGPELVQRPQSAMETCYTSIEASPSSVGPPTPGNGPMWSNFDPTALGYIPETQCVPSRQYTHSTSPPWNTANSIVHQLHQELAMPPQAVWN